MVRICFVCRRVWPEWWSVWRSSQEWSHAALPSLPLTTPPRRAGTKSQPCTRPTSCEPWYCVHTIGPGFKSSTGLFNEAFTLRHMLLFISFFSSSLNIVDLTVEVLLHGNCCLLLRAVLERTLSGLDPEAMPMSFYKPFSAHSLKLMTMFRRERRDGLGSLGSWDHLKFVNRVCVQVCLSLYKRGRTFFIFFVSPPPARTGSWLTGSSCRAVLRWLSCIPRSNTRPLSLTTAACRCCD